MFDMHQGFTGEETRDLPPSVGTIAMAQLEVASRLVRGEWRAAARAEIGAVRVAASLLRDGVRKRLARASR